jgi:hypothetical protein
VTLADLVPVFGVILSMFVAEWFSGGGLMLTVSVIGGMLIMAGVADPLSVDPTWGEWVAGAGGVVLALWLLTRVPRRMLRRWGWLSGS